MIDEIKVLFLHLNGRGCVGQDFDRVTLFEIVLAHSRIRRFTRELPVRRGVREERVAERLRQFMTKGSHVLEPAPKRPGEIQLAYWLMERCCGTRVSAKFR